MIKVVLAVENRSSDSDDGTNVCHFNDDGMIISGSDL